MEVNEYILSHKDDKDERDRPSSAGNGTEDEDTNKGVLTLDAI